MNMSKTFPEGKKKIVDPKQKPLIKTFTITLSKKENEKFKSEKVEIKPNPNFPWSGFHDWIKNRINKSDELIKDITYVPEYGNLFNINLN